MLGKIGRWLLARGAKAHLASESTERLAKRPMLRAQPFPDEWRAHVALLPHYKRLTDEQREKLHGDIMVFVGEKEFVGEGGFVVDDRVRVIVAASAALLVLGRDIAMYDHVRRIVMRFEVDDNIGGHYMQMQSKLGDDVVDEWAIVELGWARVLSGYLRPEGQNTALHEFAHAFDDADGKLDALLAHPKYERWRTLLHELPLWKRVEGDQIITEIVGDASGPELFASATELFFECPNKLRDLDRELFDTLCEIYAIDPLEPGSSS